jgi:hypothetical protein
VLDESVVITGIQLFTFGERWYICVKNTCMEGMLITPKSAAEKKFLSDLFKRMGLVSTIISLEQMEDIGLSQMMHEVDKSEKTTREAIMKKLRS